MNKIELSFDQPNDWVVAKDNPQARYTAVEINNCSIKQANALEKALIAAGYDVRTDVTNPYKPTRHLLRVVGLHEEKELMDAMFNANLSEAK